MTTPAQDAPLVFPSIAFRPLLLLVISAALGAVAVLASGLLGHVMVGVFFAVGLVFGLLNAVAVKRAATKITAVAHPLKRQMALNSTVRLAVITLVALTVAFVFRPEGLGVVFGLALFQMLLVVTTTVPVVKALRDGGADATEGRASSDE